MSEETPEIIEEESVPKSKVNDIVNSRLEQNNKKWTDQINKQGQLIETLQGRLDQIRSTPQKAESQEPTQDPQAQPVPGQQQTTEQNTVQPQVTPEIVAQMMAEEKQHQVAIKKINDAAIEDKELGDMLNNGQAKAQVPEHLAVTLVNMMGNDALPAIKKALADPAANQELLSMPDLASVINWAHRVKAESPAGQKTKEYKDVPDIMSAGNSSAPSDDDDIKNIVANTII